MKTNKKLIMGGLFVLIIIGIVIISLLMKAFVFNRIGERESVNQSQDDTNKIIELNPDIDYSKLDAALEKVPEHYNIRLSKTWAADLKELLDYVDLNKSTMTQELVNSYAVDIEKALEFIYPLSEIPQLYLKNNEGVITREYTSISVALLDKEGGEFEEIIDEAAELKIRGNSSTEVVKKTYTIKFSEKQDVLGMGKAKKWALIANAFDKSLMRNKMVFDFAKNIGLEYSPDCTFVDLYLNGRYMGNYLVTEVVEEAAARVDIDSENGDFLIEREYDRVDEDTTYFRTPIFGYRFGINEPEVVSDEQLETITEFFRKVEQAIQDRDWELFTSYVDERSYIDFYITNELFKVVDIDYSSTRFYIKDGKLYGGPPWDNDLSSGNAEEHFYYDYNYHEGFGPNSSYLGLWCNKNLYSYCYEFPEFKEALSKRYLELQDQIVNLYEDNSFGKNQIDLLIERFGKSFERNFTNTGWGFINDFILERVPESTFEGNVEYLRDWLKKRNEYLLTIIG
ncbi:MAG: CotH kinase family protein [Mobilitalea sp.]